MAETIETKVISIKDASNGNFDIALKNFPQAEPQEGVVQLRANVIQIRNAKNGDFDLVIPEDHTIEDALIQNTPMDEYVNDRVREIPDYGMYKGGIKKLIMKNLNVLRARALMNSQLTEGYFPKVTLMNNEAFRDCHNLKKVDIGILSSTVNLGLLTFANDESLEVLIIRKPTVIEPTVNTFQGTPFASDGTGGYVYVPQNLLSQYQASTAWQTYANVLEFRAIEGSEYEIVE